MKHKFGIFKTVDELNMAAAAQKAEGDEEALISLALENGLDREDAEDYMDGGLEYLCTPYMAAVGKLDMEEKELGLKSQLKDWKDFIVQLASEKDGLPEAIFNPEKHLADVLAAGLKKASVTRILVPSRISGKAGLGERPTYIGMCGRDELQEIVLAYYMGGES